MASIDTSVSRTVSSQRAILPKAVEINTEDNDTTSERATSLRKTALHQAFELNDDLSGLLSSLRRSRAREADGSDMREQVWLDHVLESKGPEKLAALRLQLKQLPVKDVAAMRALIATLFPDPSDAVAVLRTLMSEAELEDIRNELATLHDELLDQPDGKGRKVRAGLNVALKARLNAAPLAATAPQLRHTYQEFLEGGEPLDAYEQWVELYGFARRSRVITFIEQALAADMYALDPSCTRVEFGLLLQRVRQLTTLRSADHLLMASCWQPALMTRIGVDQHTLLSALLRMVRHGGGLADLMAGIFSGMRFTLTIEEKARFVQSVRRFLKAIPHALWVDIGLQLQVMEDVETVLDRVLKHERSHSRGARWVTA